MVFIDRTGEKHTTNEGYKVKITSCRGSLDCDIIFESGYEIKNLNYHQIKNGQVKNPFHPSVYGVGFVGVGNYVAHIKRKPTKSYGTWIGMLRRCYSEKSLIRRPTYKNVSVCEKWLNFQNFAQWFEENYIEGLDLDKDLLSGNNKIYSPETCCFLSNEENNRIKRSQ
jgi:hypothetical protein